MHEHGNLRNWPDAHASNKNLLILPNLDFLFGGTCTSDLA